MTKSMRAPLSIFKVMLPRIRSWDRVWALRRHVRTFYAGRARVCVVFACLAVSRVLAQDLVLFFFRDQKLDRAAVVVLAT
jgi:hypothetical protein